MKRIFNILATAAITFAMPASALAVEARPTDPNPNERQATTGLSCGAGLLAAKTKASDSVGGKTKEIDSKKAEHEAKKTKLQTDRKTTVDERKASADKLRDEEFTKVDAQATTEAQKQAATIFKATVKTAMEARKASYDQARETFKTGVDAVVTSHKTQTTGQVTGYKAAVDAAFAKATSACQATTPNVQVIMSTLKLELSNARKTFKDGRQSDTKVSADIKALVEARKKSMTDANALFKDTVTKARETLKAAWGNTAI
jgi:hypothetical protein